MSGARKNGSTRRRFVGRRQTDDPTLVRLFDWLRRRPGVSYYEAELIVDYVDERFKPKGQR